MTTGGISRKCEKDVVPALEMKVQKVPHNLLLGRGGGLLKTHTFLIRSCDVLFHIFGHTESYACRNLQVYTITCYKIKTDFMNKKKTLYERAQLYKSYFSRHTFTEYVIIF